MPMATGVRNVFRVLLHVKKVGKLVNWRAADDAERHSCNVFVQPCVIIGRDPKVSPRCILSCKLYPAG